MTKAQQFRVGALEDFGPAGGAITKPLHAFRLEPAAGPHDPNWDLAPAHGIIIVNAFSPADARLVAAEAEVDFLDIDAAPADGTSTRHASAFRSDKLYSVVRIGPAKGPRGIVTDAA